MQASQWAYVYIYIYTSLKYIAVSGFVNVFTLEDESFCRVFDVLQIISTLLQKTEVKLQQRKKNA